MDKFLIRGGARLEGSIDASGSKNAALPILISSLLASGRCEYSRVPALSDIGTTCRLLEALGAKVSRAPGGVFVDPPESTTAEAPYDLVRTMRASVIVLGPLVARFGKAKVSLPGGCAIGARPIGMHLDGLEKLGARIRLEGGYVFAEADRLVGARIRIPFPSVGATENLVLAASLAKGLTQLENCAREPEIVDLVQALRAMGARIRGEGTATIEVEGVDALAGCRHEVMGDRIEVGTYLAAAVVTRGSVEVRGASADWMRATLSAFQDLGAEVSETASGLCVTMAGRPRACHLETAPFPGLPTDMQAQLMACLALGDGTSTIRETIFENRFMHVPELERLGARILVRGETATIEGQASLAGAPVMATDLRASASLVLAGLAASGETIVNRVYHLDRGYERMERKLVALGARIERISDERGSVSSS